MPVGKQTPFWALSQLGGDRSIVGSRQPLRGFGDARFSDKNLFAANLELRTRVLGLDLFNTHAVLELAPFVDVGRVFHPLDDNPFSALHPVGGLGFRGIAAPFVIGYVDFGYGGEGISVFSGINYPF
jgi:hemolysin activation/secretion protein